MDLVDELDASGKKWGAINTIRFEAQDEGGVWQPLGSLPPDAVGDIRTVGFNTDADAIMLSLSEDLGAHVRGASVLLMGTGGAGQVVALRLAEEGAKRLFLLNRTASKADAIARQVAERFPGTAVVLGYPPEPVELAINATSLGLRNDDPLPFDTSRFRLSQAAAVYDLIYRPAETRLLREAKQAGCRVANGLGMLLYQGAKALEIWTGQSAPISAMKRALEQNVYGR
jgi:shikimate dehydrogenase